METTIISYIYCINWFTFVKKEMEIETTIQEDIKILNTINEATQHLSETINAFRDFFHPNKEKVNFKLSDVYKKNTQYCTNTI